MSEEEDIADSQYPNPGTPPELRESYAATRRDLLPAKSGILYTKSYNSFVKWQKDKKTTSTSVRVLLSYFNELSKTRAPSTLWSEYSKLKSTLQLHQGINIGTYDELIALLKKKSKGYQPKKAPALTGLQVENFLLNASDAQYLFEKVALTVGILVACRREELVNMKTNDMELFFSDRDREKKDPMLLVRIPLSKNGEARSFIVKGGFYQIVQRYINLRAFNTGLEQFFVNYQNGKCTKQPIGINKMGGVPNTIAKFLELPDAARYTSHTIRHTGASLFVEGGGNMEDLKRLGGWKSSTAATGYITHSKSSKEKICDKITSAIILPGTSSTSNSTVSATKTASTSSFPGPSSEPSSARSSLEISSTNNITNFTSKKRSLINLPVSDTSVPNKENVFPIDNRPLGPGLTLSIADCTNCTFHIADKKDS